ncbi:MAG: glycoside hydrolase family 15 protein, partial [Gaiellaceae bacterium]
MSTVPIAEHALLSDCHSAALVTRAGSVDWLCFPRFDSPSVFGRMLDDAAGHWSLRPVRDAPAIRRYLDRSMVLETSFATGSGTLVVTDALALGPAGNAHRLGKDAPHLLVRAVRADGGPVDVQLEYAPRPEYGLVRPLLSDVDGGVSARGGAEWLVLSTPVGVSVDGSTGRARFTLAGGDTLYFGLHRSTLGESPARVWSQPDLAAALDRTRESWREWCDLHQSYQGPWQDLVHTSGRVLQALTYFPSGAIVAAATTSLPEAVGGERNWDYRYSWVRDASFTMEALWVAACPDEAGDFFAFMTTAAAASVSSEHALQIMVGVGGEHDLSERELDHLAGWRDSRPVRVGNGAWRQQQIDVYGELLSAAHRLADQISGMDDDLRRFLVALADAAAVRWRETDQGIWEVRGEPRHFLYSKVMCWVALDRAVRLATDRARPADVPRWTEVRDEIYHQLMERGW